MEMASAEMNNNMSFEFTYENAKALSKLKDLGVSLRKFPEDVNIAGKKALSEVVSELSTKNYDFKRVWESIDSFMKIAQPLSDITVKNFLQTR